MKAIALKPLTWNTAGYTVPSGAGANSGYPQKYGFGHEEWNANDNRLWRGYRVFHTQATDNLRKRASDGELGILMISSRNRKQYAVGIATGVWANSKPEQALIADELSLYDHWREAWHVDTVREAFGGNQASFLKHWDREYSGMQWKCRSNSYFQFKKAIPLNVKSFTSRERVVTDFATHQYVHPAVVDSLLEGMLRVSHPIRAWLRTGEFDLSLLNKYTRKPRGGKSGKRRGVESNAPGQAAYQYWVEGNREVEPAHWLLQGKYFQWLKQKGYQEIKENENYVDIRYRDKSSSVFAEVKPTSKVPPKYAIRFAIGQLLDYKFRQKHEGKLEIVIGSKPESDDVDFVRSLKMSLVYYSKAQDEFIRCC